VSKKFFLSLAGLFVAASSILALNGFMGTSSAVVDNDPDCDTVAIIKCGAFSESKLREKAAKGDVPKVMSAFGISQSELNGFVSGIVWRDGRVTVGDKVVATGAVTAGRWNTPKSGMTRIPGTDRAYKMSTSNFVTEGQTAFVKMVNGQFAFAVIKSCGNPVTAKPKPQPKPPTPEVACVSLTAKQTVSNIPDKKTYSFTATGSAKNGAKITSYRYEFGDGATDTTTDRTVTHSYNPGDYVAKLTVIFDVNGKTEERTARACTVPIKVAEQEETVFECTQLEAALINKEERRYKYTLTYVEGGKATLRSVDFDFGDNSSLNDVKPADLDNIEHAYAEAKEYVTTATLHFDVVVGGFVGIKKEKDTCKVKVTPEQPEECKPGVPVNSPECDECKPGVPADSDECEEGEVLPASIVKTGPAEIAVGGLGLSSIAGAGYYWRASRRKLIDKLLNR